MINLVKKLKYGNTNTFFIQGELGNILLDTDYAGTMMYFYKAIKEKDIKINDIDYVIATHYHPDHMGLISQLVAQGVKLLLVDRQISSIGFSDEIFKRDQKLNYESIDINNAKIIKITESRSFLKSLGIDGEILSTPSHSEDSVTLILDNGICFVGDLEPIEYLVAYDKNNKLKNDWDLISRYNPKIIYYSHMPERKVK